MYTFFLLGLCKSYFETLSLPNPTKYQIENVTAALISFCPNGDKRKELWALYLKTRDDSDSGGGSATASVMAIGELVTYLSETLELEEDAVGGVM